jgi:hypothetical protein
MDKKQKEALVLALLEKGESYRDISQKAKVSPNTIKAISNRAGLDVTTSISSRAFELFSEGKTPLDVAIELKIEAEEAIRLHRQYIILLGCTEFTRIYPQIKDNPWPYVNLVNLIQNAGISGDDVVELLRIANGHLPMVRLEYDRLKQDKNSLQSEINSLEAEKRNSVRIYQGFCDRNLTLKKREAELQLTVKELEAKVAELQQRFDMSISELQDLSEDEKPYYPPKIGSSSRTLIFDTTDLF